MTEPLKPSDVISAKKKQIPEVIEAFNHLIAERIDSSGTATVYQEDAIFEIMARVEGLSRSEIFERKMLDVENIYKDAGWKVIYRSPDYTESFRPYFEFRSK